MARLRSVVPNNCFIQIEQDAEPGPRDVTVFDPVNGDDTLAAGFQVV